MSKESDFLASPSKTTALAVEGKAINKESFERNRKNSTENKASASFDRSAKESDGSINAAEQLLIDIDDISAAFEYAKSKSNNRAGKTKSVMQHSVHSDTDKNGVSSSEQSSFLSLTGSSLKPNTRQSKLEAFDSTGELNLDVLEKWVSTTVTEISWPSGRKESITTSTSESGGKSTMTRLRQSDIAVEEIDAIIASISDGASFHTNDCKALCTSKEIEIREVDATVTENIQTPPSTSSAFDFSVPATSLVQPLAAVRLPPLKGAALENGDIFNRKLTDMSLLHIPRYLPKLEKVNSKQLEQPQSCEERVGVSERTQVGHFTTRVAKDIPEVLLPGQVSENKSDGKQESVRFRRVILDYSMSNDQNKKKKATKSKFLKLFACCRAQTDNAESEVDRYSVGCVKDSLEEIRFDIDMSPEQSTRRGSLWQRIKKCLGF